MLCLSSPLFTFVEGYYSRLECRMVANRFGECRLEVEEALVEGRGILAIQRDHLRPRLATADDLERIMFYSLDHSLRQRRSLARG